MCEASSASGDTAVMVPGVGGTPLLLALVI